LLDEVNATIDAAALFPALQIYAGQLRDAVTRMGHVLAHLQQFAAAGQTERYMADANLFMELTSFTVVAWQWLKQGIVTQQMMAEKDDEFYFSKMETMKFFYKYELPKTEGLSSSLLCPDQITMNLDRSTLM
jgi:butyryl-CoA dehydrogenase